MQRPPRLATHRRAGRGHSMQDTSARPRRSHVVKIANQLPSPSPNLPPLTQFQSAAGGVCSVCVAQRPPPQRASQGQGQSQGQGVQLRCCSRNFLTKEWGQQREKLLDECRTNAQRTRKGLKQRRFPTLFAASRPQNGPQNFPRPQLDPEWMFATHFKST